MKTTLCSAALLACGMLAGAAAQADTLKKIADSGKITLAYRESSVPFSYLAGAGAPIGFSVDISNAVVDAVKKKLNKPDLKVELQAVTSQNRIPLVTNGTVDLECGSTTNNTARAKDVQFAVNYFYTGTRLLVKKSSGVKNYADLAKKTVASTTGTTNAQVIRKYNRDNNLEMDIILGKDHNDSMLLVDTGRALAFAMDDILLFGLKANAVNPAEWDVVGDALQVEPYACMLRKDDPQFQALVNGVIGGMMKSGEFEKLYNKWFLSPIAPKGQALGLPMSKELRDNLTAQSDKPAV
ncbi:transporter substrate-binding domain-containing protein [Paracidovorax citrulli]|uniref:Amino acid ABC transporter substrate-binding protein, PAAT family n=2 Tax=Paracidovorax citrulli TaxID=80869 RepID=A1TNI3_PARC0|nr:transporter substrate-binding domain-containing protein [Paracidovorax citrulli]ABM32521.1 amino acid ABC transporter substrate-binding protein, PAAT family [Paracidovorax citrulli AAC00-1]ATG93452.1 amino acid ABC transporter substrate-binding protein [Paracidovorax citrulli]MVT27898.1 transporter substrate-binding domain-containing protein [Paracidovorax citrulli]MVT36968.1 transporter substrate-binding domain-containing protein [Paracidovorax citrulli]PVY66737.1 amino acid ABC transporte